MKICPKCKRKSMYIFIDYEKRYKCYNCGYTNSPQWLQESSKKQTGE